MNHLARLAVVIVLSSGLAVPAWSQSVDSPSHGAASDLNRINPKFLVTPEEAQRWHTAKDLLGPALSGNPSWKVFMTIVEEKLREYGAVDLRRNTWTYDRWHTSEWPDDSKWSLVSNGKPLRVASYGANSGATAEAGVTADLVFYDPAKPPASIEGKIVVFQTTPEDENTPADRRTYEYPGDYLYLSNPDTFPDPRIPRKTTMTVSTRAEMRQATELPSETPRRTCRRGSVRLRSLV